MQIGIKHVHEHVVTSADLAQVQKSGELPVLATPKLLAWLEESCWMSVGDLLENGETTVGTYANFKHLAASAEGAKIRVETCLTLIDRKRLVFDVKAYEGNILLAEGQLERFIVNSERFLKKLRDRQA